MEIINEMVVYTTEGRQSRGVVHAYHGKPSPRDLKKGGKKDIGGIPSKAVAKRVVDPEGNSKYSIGFEVEKNALSRGAVREYELFCGFERDGSCGYEAVTNILPLLPASMWRTKVFDMMHKASRIIEDCHSPSDERCGGHITVAVDGLSGEELLAKMRPVAGLFFAMFRHRLKNRYCGANLRLEPETLNLSNGRGSDMWTSNRLIGSYNGYHSKYRVALPKGNCLEWRLPSRFTSVAQMRHRYEFMYLWVDYVMSTNKPSLKAFMDKKEVQGILSMLYEGDKEKVVSIKVLAYHMQEFINTGRIDPCINKFIVL
jgi:hypothetical protein